jgi:hypothetical protein
MNNPVKGTVERITFEAGLFSVKLVGDEQTYFMPGEVSANLYVRLGTEAGTLSKAEFSLPDDGDTP